MTSFELAFCAHVQNTYTALIQESISAATVSATSTATGSATSTMGLKDYMEEYLLVTGITGLYVS